MKKHFRLIVLSIVLSIVIVILCINGINANVQTYKSGIIDFVSSSTIDDFTIAGISINDTPDEVLKIMGDPLWKTQEYNPSSKNGTVFDMYMDTWI